MMKKLFIFIICLSFCLLLCSCNNAKTIKLNSFIVGESSTLSVVSVDTKSSCGWWNGSYENNEAAKSITYTFDGKEYQALYSYSDKFFGNTKDVNVYKSDGVEITFWADSGEFEGIHFHLYRNGYTDRPKVDSPREYAIEYAWRIASNYIDVSDYEMTVSEYSPNKDNENYDVFFAKVIDGYETPDYIKTHITAQGDMQTLHLGEIGLFDDFDRELPTKEEVNESIIATLDTLFKDSVYEDYKCEIKEINRQILTYSPDGDLVILTSASLKLSKKGCQDVNTAFTFATVIE